MILKPVEKKLDMPKDIMHAFNGELRYDKDCTGRSRAVPNYIRNLFLFYYDCKTEEELPPIYNILDGYGCHVAYIVRETEFEYGIFLTMDSTKHNPFKLENALISSSLVDKCYGFKVLNIDDIFGNAEYLNTTGAKVWSKCYFTGISKGLMSVDDENIYRLDIRPYSDKFSIIDDIQKSLLPFITYKTFWAKTADSSKSELLKHTLCQIDKVEILVTNDILFNDDEINFLISCLCIPQLIEWGISELDFKEKFRFKLFKDYGAVDETESIVRKLYCPVIF